MTAKAKMTVREVARLAGVSASTVSLVLNDKGNISPATRARVLEVAHGLPRRQNREKQIFSRSIRFLKIAKHGNTVNRDHSHFISDYIDGMSAETKRLEYRLQVESYEKFEASEILETLDVDDDGVVILGTELSESDVTVLARQKIPTVFIDTMFDGVEANMVDMDNFGSVRKALTHLSNQGYQLIGYVGSDAETRNFALRESAFLANMEELNLKMPGQAVLKVRSTHKGSYQDSLQILKRTKLAEAYFCANDVIALGFSEALKETGIRIPEDVALVGFDNLPISSAIDPSLSTIDVSKRTIGKLSIRTLHDIIGSKLDQPSVKILVGSDLIERQSSSRRTMNSI